MLNTVIDPTTTIEQAAEKLGCLLAGLPEFQQYVRTDRAVRYDPQASEIQRQINAYSLPFFPFDEIPASLNELYQQMQAQPVVQEFMAANAALRGTFAEVDEIITQVSGLPFAENIRKCGSS